MGGGADHREPGRLRKDLQLYFEGQNTTERGFVGRSNIMSLHF